MEIGTHSCLIAKEHVGLLLSLQGANLRIFLFNPFLNTFLILLKGTPEWLLRAKTKLIQQSTYQCFAEANAELTPDQFCYPIFRPKRKRKLHLSGFFPGHRIINPPQHLMPSVLVEVSMLASIQGTPFPTSIFGLPAEQCRSLLPKRLSYQLWRLSILNSKYSPFSQFCEFIMRKPSCIVFSHINQSIKYFP